MASAGYNMISTPIKAKMLLEGVMMTERDQQVVQRKGRAIIVVGTGITNFARRG
jgi:hypothetical protein